MTKSDLTKNDSIIKWHRLFGLTLTDFFTNTPYEVVLEKELTLQQQYVDAVIIRKDKDQEFTDVPDGLDNLSDYNLISYKSHQESLSDWTIEELIEYYALYRKLLSPSPDNLIGVDKFRLYAVSTRYPRKLFSLIKTTRVREGVYDFIPILNTIRIIVLKSIPDKPENAIWDLFSAVSEKVRYGAEHYQWKRPNLNSVVNQLLKKYHLEGINMPYTIEDYKQELINEVLKQYPPEEVLKQYSSEDRLKGLSLKEIEEYLKKQKGK